MMIDGSLLRLEKVYKRFPLPGGRTLRAINGVSFTLDTGKCLAVVGESGCGKSTLAKMISRVETVTEGTIYFNREPITHLRGRKLRALRRNMQIIFQDPVTAFSPRMKIGEILCEPFINFENFTKKDAMKKACEILEAVELSRDRLGCYPHQLSGGELQRVAIIRAMALSPALLICDEPTSALDVSIQKRILDLLYGLRHSSGVAMLFISHDLSVVSRISDHIMVLYMGYVMEKLPNTDVNTRAKHPYTKALLQSAFNITRERDDVIGMLGGETPGVVDESVGCPFRSRCAVAGKLCMQVVPTLKEVAPGHVVACHYVE